MDTQDQVYLQFLGFLRTPELWTTTEHFAYPQFHVKEKQMPAALKKELLLPERLVLGRRIEFFFYYYISFFSEEEILAKNTPIFAEKITIGEIDFILRNPESGETTHVELMYKFYLYDPGIPGELESWIGPNRRDTLCKKLRKLRDQQFPLLFREETRKLLRGFSCDPENVVQKVCFKANLFVPLEFRRHSFPFINNDCIQGYWIKLSDFTIEEYGDFSFYSPGKADWPVEPEYWTKWVSFAEIRSQVNVLLSAEKSPLVWMKDHDSKCSRFFVVWW